MRLPQKLLHHESIISDCPQTTIEYTLTNDGIRVNWTENPCAAKYTITHVANGEVRANFTVSPPVISAHVQTRICSENQIIISTIPIEEDKKFEDVHVNISIGINGEVHTASHFLNFY